MHVPIRVRTRVRVKGPTGTRRVKGAVSGPAEDLRLVSEVEAGVNVRPAGGVRWQGAGSLPQEATRHRYQAANGCVWTHLPSTRRFLVSNSCHLDMDWKSGNQWAGRRVCGTARSGIWVLKGIRQELTCASLPILITFG